MTKQGRLCGEHAAAYCFFCHQNKTPFYRTPKHRFSFRGLATESQTPNRLSQNSRSKVMQSVHHVLTALQHISLCFAKTWLNLHIWRAASAHLQLSWSIPG
jgi:hypothetical protein